MPEFVAVGFFDGNDVELQTPPATETEIAAWQNFQNLSSEDRRLSSRHVFAFYLDFHDASDGVDWLDDKMDMPNQFEDIWPHVQPRVAHVQSGSDTSAFVVIEADCDWDEENGLMLVFHNGQYLTKVSKYDGFMTNVEAYGDPRLDNVVYKSGSHDFTTYVEA